MFLNLEQKEAINFSLPIFVKAGAGTGKTRVLVEKYIYLLERKGAQPADIVAFTFTNAAADEMIYRIRERIEEKAVSDSASQNGCDWRELLKKIDETRISTVHSFCSSILSEYPFESGIPIGYEIISELEQAVFTGNMLEKVIAENSMNKALAAVKIENLRKTLNVILNQAVMTGKKPDDFSRWNNKTAQRLVTELRSCDALLENEKDAFIKERNLVYDLASKAWGRFIDYKLGKSRKSWESSVRLISYDELQTSLVDMFEREPDILAKVKEDVKYLLVDESQDLDPMQKQIIDYLTLNKKGEYENLFLVGDHRQSIYSFRGGDVELLESFVEKSPAVSLKMNFRSKEPILYFVNNLFKNIFQSAPLEPGDEAQKEGGGVQLWVYPAAKSNHGVPAPLEAGHVAYEIHRLVHKEKKYNYGDIAILARQNNVLAEYSQEMLEYDIPFVTASSGNIWQEQPFDELVNLLEALLNPSDNLIFASVLRSPFVGLSKLNLSKIILAAKEEPIFSWLQKNLYGDLLQPEEKKALDDYIKAFSELLKSARNDAPERLINKIYDTFNPVARYCAVSHDKSATYADIFNRIQQIARSVETAEGSLPDFVRTIRQAQALAHPPEVSASQPAGMNAVTLATVHKAKGLEWPVVFLVQSAKMSTNKGPYYHKDYGVSSLSKGAFQSFIKEKQQVAERNEMNRLLYVAMTRAKEMLYISGMKVTEAGNSFNGVLFNNLPKWSIKCKKWKAGQGDEDEIITLFDRQYKVKITQKIDEVATPEEFLPYSVNTNKTSQLPSPEEVLQNTGRIEREPAAVSQISVTTLASFGVCPFAFYKSYEMKAADKSHSVGPSLSGGAAEFGILFHDLIAQADFHAPADVELERLMKLGAAYKRERWFDAKKLERHLNSALDSKELREIIGRYERVEKELPFYFPMQTSEGAAVVAGKIDLALSGRKGLFIIDYKTGRINDDIELAQYRRQLMIYALAAFKRGKTKNDKIRMALFMTETGDLVEFLVDWLALHYFAHDIKKDIGLYVKQTPEIRAGDYCESCSLKSICTRRKQ